MTDAYVSEDELETLLVFFFSYQRLFPTVNTIMQYLIKINKIQLKSEKTPKWQNNDMTEIYIGFSGSISLNHGSEVAG